MSADEDVVERLDRLITLFRIAFADPLDRLRSEIKADPTADAILDIVRDAWVSSGEIKRSVSRKVKVSDRTVLRSLMGLTERGLLLSRGSGRSTSYRSSGVL
jgi:hypothetical protein